MANSNKPVVLMDVDGTLASAYRDGVRVLRPTAREALQRLSTRAQVYLWSAAGAENGRRLLAEFPELRPLVLGCLAKGDSAVASFPEVYSIDDVGDDDVLKHNHVILGEMFDGGSDSGLLLEAVDLILATIDEA